MSTKFRFDVRIAKIKKEEINKVKNVLRSMWDWQDIESYPDKTRYTIYADGESSLSFNDDHGFSRELSEAIWEKLKRFVSISVTATCLENLPYEEYIFDKDEYKDWKN